VKEIQQTTGDCHIFFLARKQHELRVFCYREWPWINAEHQRSEQSKSNFPEPTLFILSGAVNLEDV